MSHHRIMSNVGVGMQRIFGAARARIRDAFHDPSMQAYNKMTPAQRMAHDAEMFEMDHHVSHKQHKKMIDKQGADYADRLMDELLEPSSKKSWW